MPTYRIGRCRVTLGPSSVTTEFTDGSRTVGMTNGDVQQFYTAQSLGYGTDVDRMNIEHDLLHTLVAHARGLDVSPTLQAVASGTQVDPTVADDEERIVMLVQRLLNVGLAGVLADYDKE